MISDQGMHTAWSVRSRDLSGYSDEVYLVAGGADYVVTDCECDCRLAVVDFDADCDEDRFHDCSRAWCVRCGLKQDSEYWRYAQNAHEMWSVVVREVFGVAHAHCRQCLGTGQKWISIADRDGERVGDWAECDCAFHGNSAAVRSGA